MLKLLYKHKGISSFKFIKQFARENNIKKIGHSGTLDPMASGLLLVATDEETKILNLISNKEKKYFATAVLGYGSDTYDAQGNIFFVSDKKVTEQQLKKTLKKFQGSYLQIPPKYSAKKVNGKRAYKLARDNQDFQLKPKEVKIFAIDLVDFDFEKQFFSFNCWVSNGTYIRSLIYDIGQCLKTGAYMSDLERYSIHNLDKTYLEKNINPLDLIDEEEFAVNYSNLKKLFEGKEIKVLKQLNGKYALVYKNTFLGILEFEYSKIKKRNLLGTRIVNILSKGE